MEVHRGIVDITPAALNEAHQADLAIQATEGIDFKHVWTDPGVSMALCLSDAPRRYRRNLWMSPWHENAAYLPP
jgi:uncharacterized protein DUF4242